MLPILLSLGGLDALAPVIIIIILIAAAAGLTRGADIFAILGVGSLLGIASGFGGGGAGRGLGRGSAKFSDKGAAKAAGALGRVAGSAAGLAAAKGLERRAPGLATRLRMNNPFTSQASRSAKTWAILAAQQRKQDRPQKGGLVRFATKFSLTPRPGTKAITAARMKEFKARRAQINREFRTETTREVRKLREAYGEMAPKTRLGAALSAAFGGISSYMIRSRDQRLTGLLIKNSDLTGKYFLGEVDARSGKYKFGKSGIVPEKDRPALDSMHQRYSSAYGAYFEYRRSKETLMVQLEEARADLKRGKLTSNVNGQIAVLNNGVIPKASAKLAEAQAGVAAAQKALADAKAGNAPAGTDTRTLQQNLKASQAELKLRQNDLQNAQADMAAYIGMRDLNDKIAQAKSSGATAAQINDMQNDLKKMMQDNITRLGDEYRKASQMERSMEAIKDRASVAMEEFIAKHHDTPSSTMSTLANAFNPVSWYRLSQINAINSQLSDPALKDPKEIAAEKHEYAMNELFQKVYKENGYDAAAAAVGSQWLNQQIKSMSEGGIDKPLGQARMADAIRLNYADAYYKDMIENARKRGVQSGIAAFMSDISRKELERREEEMLAAHRARGVLEQRHHVYAPDLIQQHIDMKKKFEDYARRMQSPH